MVLCKKAVALDRYYVRGNPHDKYLNFIRQVHQE